MKLTVFQSEKGDCLLLASGDTHHMLVDGGMRTSYKTFVAPALGKLAAAGKRLDLVYVSHIDQDHIAGVLQLMDDLVAWRVHDFQRKHGNPIHPEPESPRPPEVAAVWHNAFHEMVGDNAGPIGDLLAASSTVLSGADAAELREAATMQRELATSIPEAINLSRRVSAQQLDIALNGHFNGKLAFVRHTQPAPPPIAIGGLNLFVIGPFEEDLVRLREDWNEWLHDNQARLEKIRKKAQQDAERLGTNDVQALLDAQVKQASQLGNRKEVTPPNLASLMLLVEEGNRTLLLTGDGHASDILKGLAYHNKLDDQQRIHVDVLKVQHHGSEHNLDAAFAAKVTADHYIFCGNGEHENPDLRVVRAIVEARLGTGPSPADHPAAAGNFKLWFNSSEKATKKSKAQEHMKRVEALVAQLTAGSGGRMSAFFLQAGQPFFDLSLP